MSEKELLYVEDALGHLEYFHRHLSINSECLNDTKNENCLKKIMKKTNDVYSSFYNLLKECENNGR